MRISQLSIDIATTKRLPMMVVMVFQTKNRVIQEPDDGNLSSPVL
ncbi:hypothetical protein [Microseira sp. BLCC-F43]